MCATGTCPKTIDYLLQHEHAYQKELAFIENPPDGVEIIQIFASDKLQSKLLGSTDAQLRYDYKMGIMAGSSFLKKSELPSSAIGRNMRFTSSEAQQPLQPKPARPVAASQCLSA